LAPAATALHFRVFGCPASVKRYHPTTHDGETFTHRTQIQQATRAIFLGFPVAQAGWLFYLPQPIGPHRFIVSQDAIFDEAFDSAVVFDQKPFPGSLPIRSVPPTSDVLDPEYYDHQSNDMPTMEHTGSIEDLHRPYEPGEEGATEYFAIAPPDDDDSYSIDHESSVEADREPLDKIDSPLELTQTQAPAPIPKPRRSSRRNNKGARRSITYAMGRELVGTVPRKRGTQELN
jgi:hypothetical protein